MEELVRDLGIEIAVLTVPAASAQDTADALVRAGVKSIISFAPVPLHLPAHVFVEYMDITAALESAAYFARHGRANADAADENGGGEIGPMVRQLQTLLARKAMKLEDLAGTHRRAHRDPRRARRHRDRQDLRGRPRERPAQRGLRARPCW